MLLFPLIAASIVLRAGGDGSPMLGLAALLRGEADETSYDVDRSSGGSRCAKRTRPKARIRPKRKKHASPPRAAAGRDEAGASAKEGEAVNGIVPVVFEDHDLSGCLPGMVPIGNAFCVDAYEASLVEVRPDGGETPWPYFQVVPGEAVVRAVSVPGVYPQGYISGLKAREACERSGKRLCRPDEWRSACMGPAATVFPYGNAREVGRCNDNGRSSMRFLNPQLDDRPEHKWLWGSGGNMIDPRLNQLDGTLTRTGERAGCTNGYGVFDMVGNLHEWVDDPAGTFQGGYYLDTHLNGDGCYYRTTAHPISHYDYSTGFRCCADAEPGRSL